MPIATLVRRRLHKALQSRHTPYQGVKSVDKSCMFSNSFIAYWIVKMPFCLVVNVPPSVYGDFTDVTHSRPSWHLFQRSIIWVWIRPFRSGCRLSSRSMKRGIDSGHEIVFDLIVLNSPLRDFVGAVGHERFDGCGLLFPCRSSGESDSIRFVKSR